MKFGRGLCMAVFAMMVVKGFFHLLQLRRVEELLDWGITLAIVVVILTAIVIAVKRLVKR